VQFGINVYARTEDETITAEKQSRLREMVRGWVQARKEVAAEVVHIGEAQVDKSDSGRGAPAGGGRRGESDKGGGRGDGASDAAATDAPPGSGSSGGGSGASGGNGGGGDGAPRTAAQMHRRAAGQAVDTVGAARRAALAARTGIARLPTSLRCWRAALAGTAPRLQQVSVRPPTLHAVTRTVMGVSTIAEVTGGRSWNLCRR